MEKIIGIQTPHYAPNYGAKLQAFALGEAIRQLGFQIEYINRRPLCASMYKGCLDRFLKSKEEKTLAELTKFETSYLQPQTLAMYDNHDFVKINFDKYYAIVVGSDQMWRDDYFHAGFELTPYLFYVEQQKLKRIAYAVSFGKNSCSHPEGRKREIERLINKFDNISVREQSGKTILRDVFHVEGSWVCDPTLLHDARTYIRTFGINKRNDINNVIVTYILDQSTKFFHCADIISEKMGIPVKHIIQKKLHDIFYKRPLYRIPDLHKRISVEDWLHAILNARFVVTDSYHGMLFSILFEKQFVVYNRKAGGSERYHSILDFLGLSDRLFSESDSLDLVSDKLQTKIDYSIVNERLNDFRHLSWNYLKDSLA